MSTPHKNIENSFAGAGMGMEGVLVHKDHIRERYSRCRGLRCLFAISVYICKQISEQLVREILYWDWDDIRFMWSNGLHSTRTPPPDRSKAWREARPLLRTFCCAKNWHSIRTDSPLRQYGIICCICEGFLIEGILLRNNNNRSFLAYYYYIYIYKRTPRQPSALSPWALEQLIFLQPSVATIFSPNHSGVYLFALATSSPAYFNYVSTTSYDNATKFGEIPVVLGIGLIWFKAVLEGYEFQHVHRLSLISINSFSPFSRLPYAKELSLARRVLLPVICHCSLYEI